MISALLYVRLDGQILTRRVFVVDVTRTVALKRRSQTSRGKGGPGEMDVYEQISREGENNHYGVIGWGFSVAIFWSYGSGGFGLKKSNSGGSG